MLGVRARLYPWIERGVLATGWLRADQPRQWSRYARLVFVCSGNICRSPYAEAAARRCGLAAISCGIATEQGLPADGTAIKEAAQRGLDLTSHRTTRWQDVEIGTGDIVVAMQLRHALTVLPRATAHACQVIMLSSLLLPKFAPICDPYGKPQDQFRRVFDLIDSGVLRMAQLRRLAESGTT